MSKKAIKAIWEQTPRAGTRWHRRAWTEADGRRMPAETRHVIDRNLGGDVFYVSGRFYHGARQHRCTLAEWKAWVADARKGWTYQEKEKA